MWCRSMAETYKGAHAALFEAARFSTPETEEISESKRQSLQDLIEHQRNLSERDGNPLCAWFAYLHAREAGVAIPGWVVEYLDRCASEIWTLWQESMSGEAIDHTMVAKALDVVGERGEGNAFSKYGDANWMYLAERVGFYMRQGDDETYAIEDVAKRHGSTKSTVRRAWKKYKAEYPERVDEILSFTNPPIS